MENITKKVKVIINRQNKQGYSQITSFDYDPEFKHLSLYYKDGILWGMLKDLKDELKKIKLQINSIDVKEGILHILCCELF